MLPNKLVQMELCTNLMNLLDDFENEIDKEISKDKKKYSNEIKQK